MVKLHPTYKVIMPMQYRSLISTLAIAIPIAAFGFSNGPEDGYAGNPPNRSTCVACHNTFQLNSGQGRLQLQNLPEAYVPGEAYRLTISLADPNARRWGFELTALRDNNQRAGAISVTDRNTTQLSDPGGNAPAYLKHRSAGTFPGQVNSASWNFEWTAPAQDVGRVTFYLAGNAANNSGGTDGDRIYAVSSALNARVNHAPAITEPSNQPQWEISVEEGDTLVVGFEAADEDGDELNWGIFRAGGLPDDATFGAVDGAYQLSWITGDGDEGQYSPTFRVTDPDNASDTIRVIITVTAGEPDRFGITLAAGWNMISCPIPPANRDVRVMWRPVVDRGHLNLMKDQSGRFYAVGLNFSNMLPWDFRQGYLVMASSADTLIVEGDFAAENSAIPLNAGWNMVAYLPAQQQAVRDAFRNIANALVMVKNGSGQFYYRPIDFSNLPPLRRGAGYLVRVSEAVELIWNVPNRNAIQPGITEPALEHFQAVAPTVENMSLLIDIPSSTIPLREFAVLTADGQLVGSSVNQGEGAVGIAVWGDDPATEAIEGAINGEPLQLIGWNGNSEQMLEPIILEGKLAYSTDSFAHVRLDAPSPEAIGLLDAFPNPFNGSTTISFDARGEGLSLSAWDLSGRKVADLLTSSSGSSGMVTWDASTLESGVYILRLQSSTGSVTRKVALLK
jgi:hypothetical protein